jgi:hypothetical protein
MARFFGFLPSGRPLSTSSAREHTYDLDFFLSDKSRAVLHGALTDSKYLVRFHISKALCAAVIRSGFASL